MSKKLNICTNRNKTDDSDDKSVEESDSQLLQNEQQLFDGIELFVGQNSNGDRQALCSRVTAHVKHQALEGVDNDEVRRDVVLECLNDGRDEKPKEEKNEQPGKSLSNTLYKGLLEVLSFGKTRKLCVVLGQLLVDSLNDVGGRDYADHLHLIVQDGNEILGVVLKLLDAVAYKRVRKEEGMLCRDYVFDRRAVSCNDKIAQIYRAVESLVLVENEYLLDVVVVGGLLYH